MIDLYPSSRTEIDLRDELERLFHGDSIEIPKARRLILRRMRLTDDEQLIPCACLNSETKEGDRDTPCPYCFGEGFLWDEEWTDIVIAFSRLGARKTAEGISQQAPGLLHPGRVYAYCQYHVNPTYRDRILLPQVDDNNQIMWPLKVRRYYYIEKTDALRADYGWLQYWRMTIRERIAG